MLCCIQVLCLRGILLCLSCQNLQGALYLYNMYTVNFFSGFFSTYARNHDSLWVLFLQFKGSLWGFWPLVVLFGSFYVSRLSPILFVSCTHAGDTIYIPANAFTLFPWSIGGGNAMREQRQGEKWLQASKHGYKQYRIKVQSKPINYLNLRGCLNLHFGFITCRDKLECSKSF